MTQHLASLFYDLTNFFLDVGSLCLERLGSLFLHIVHQAIILMLSLELKVVLVNISCFDLTVYPLVENNIFEWYRGRSGLLNRLSEELKRVPYFITQCERTQGRLPHVIHILGLRVSEARVNSGEEGRWRMQVRILIMQLVISMTLGELLSRPWVASWIIELLLFLRYWHSS